MQDVSHIHPRGRLAPHFLPPLHPNSALVKVSSTMTVLVATMMFMSFGPCTRAVTPAAMKTAPPRRTKARGGGHLPRALAFRDARRRRLIRSGSFGKTNSQFTQNQLNPAKQIASGNLRQIWELGTTISHCQKLLARFGWNERPPALPAS